MSARRIRRITRDEVRKVSELARLELTEEEVLRFTRQLGDVLEHMEVLETLDVDGVPPTSHAVRSCAPEREDEVRAPLDRATVLALGPETEDGAFRVPKIVEG